MSFSRSNSNQVSRVLLGTSYILDLCEISKGKDTCEKTLQSLRVSLKQFEQQTVEWERDAIEIDEKQVTNAQSLFHDSMELLGLLDMGCSLKNPVQQSRMLYNVQTILGFHKIHTGDVSQHEQLQSLYRRYDELAFKPYKFDGTQPAENDARNVQSLYNDSRAFVKETEEAVSKRSADPLDDQPSKRQRKGGDHM